MEMLRRFLITNKTNRMQIKKLDKPEIEEGITLDLVNSPDVTLKTSPVIFQKGDEPVTLVKCSTGYWVCYEPGKYLKDDKGRMLVFNQRECQIARARYLLYFADKEKQEAAENLMIRRRNQVQAAIENMRNNIDKAISRAKGEKDLTYTLVCVCGDEAKKHYETETSRMAELLPEMESMYQRIIAAFEKGNITGLLDFFDIEKSENPVFSGLYNNDNDMRILKNTFSKEALERSGGNIEMLLARLKIEKEYSL